MQSVNASNWDEEVAKSEIPVLVDMYTNFCPPCRALAPVFEKVSREFDGKVKFVKLDAEANAEVAAANGVSSVPTLLFFVGGKERVRQKGFQPEGQLRNWVSTNLEATKAPE